MAPPPGTDPDALLAQAMHAELGRVLDAVPQSRRALPFLAVLEQALKDVGLALIHELPVAALQKTARQLDSLPPPREGSALSQLQMLLRLEIEDRTQPQRQVSATPFLSSFLTDDKLRVSEASESDFMRALGDPPPR